MIIIRNLQDLENQKDSVLTIGTFDGVHIGHQKLLSALVNKAKDNNLESIVVTFDPHPRDIIRPNEPKLKLLSTIQERCKYFSQFGVDKIIIIPFNTEFSKISYSEFIKNYLVDKFHVKHLIVGYDHSFGKDKEGKFDLLAKSGIKFGFGVEQIDQVYFGNYIAKSSTIRNLIIDGDLNLINGLLNRDYEFSGKVIKGDNRGKELGFPTANLEVNGVNKLIPKSGIYLVKAKLETHVYFGLLSIGTLPTFYDSHKIVVEVYLFNFTQNIYDKELTIHLIKYLREQKKFNSVEELIKAMDLDKKNGLEILEKEYLYNNLK